MSAPSADRPSSGVHRRASSGSSDSRRLLGPRLLVLTLAGLALFGYPLLGQFRAPERVAGIPALFVYLFGVWALFVGVLAWLMETRGSRRRKRRP